MVPRPRSTALLHEPREVDGALPRKIRNTQTRGNCYLRYFPEVLECVAIWIEWMDGWGPICTSRISGFTLVFLEVKAVRYNTGVGSVNEHIGCQARSLMRIVISQGERYRFGMAAESGVFRIACFAELLTIYKYPSVHKGVMAF